MSQRGSAEPDMRAVLEDLLFGSAENVPEGHLVILRKMRRNADNKLIPCPMCFHERTRNPSRVIECDTCLREGYIWDEEWKTCYSMNRSLNENIEAWAMLGDVNRFLYTYFFEHDIELTIDDKIIEPKTTSAGRPLSPVQIDAVHTPIFVEYKRGAFGRKEYCIALTEIQH